MARIGLVLGAGGIVGGAFHAGVVAGLAEVTGWDARRATAMVGTSAGSVVAASLRAGLPPRDHLARAVGDGLSPEGAALLRGGTRPVSFAATEGLRLAAPASPRLALDAVLRPWRARPGAVVAGLLPAGRVSTEGIGDGIRQLYRGRRWPERPLWLTAVRLRDGHRTVFGRDRDLPEVDVGTAVEASCAIPGFFRPVRVGGDDYLDGGTHSPSSADLLRGEELDLVVVVSTMSAERAAVRVGSGRVVPAALLGREVRALRRAGTSVLVIQPTAADLAVMGRRAMDPARRAPVARQAHESTVRRLERPDAADRVAVLRRAATEQAEADASR